MRTTLLFLRLVGTTWVVLVGLVVAAAQPAVQAGRVYQSHEVEQLPALPGATPHRQPLPTADKRIYYINTEDLSAAVQQKLVLPPAVLTGQAEGTVSLVFEVTAAGLLANARVQNSVCPTCDTAALTALRRLPRLQPARRQGQPVAVEIVVQVKLVWPDRVYLGYEYSSYFAYFPPGQLYQYLRQQLQVPSAVATGQVRGRVRVGFVVRPTGQLDSIKVTGPLCPACDAEALRLVRALPPWTPGHNEEGRPVATRQFVDIPLPLPNPATPYAEPTQVHEYGGQPPPALFDGRSNLGGAITREVQYSAAMRRDTARGYVGLEFIVDADGLVRKPRVTHSFGASYDQAALAALASMGPLIPGREYGQEQAYQKQVRVFIRPRPMLRASK